MIDYRRSDLFDELYKRYLESYELTLETEDVTGSSAYKFVLDCYTRNLKEDIKILDTEMKYYMQFCKKERKYEIKLENLNFNYIDDEELKMLTKKERYLYNRKRRKFEKINKKFKKVIQKFKLYIPEEWYNEEAEEENDAPKPEEMRTEEVQQETIIQETVTEDATLLAENNVAEATEERDITTEEGEQLQISLEDFFSDVENEDEETRE